RILASKPLFYSRAPNWMVGSNRHFRSRIANVKSLLVASLRLTYEFRSCYVLAIRSVSQNCSLPSGVRCMLELFRRMVNDCISIGLANNAPSMKRLRLLCYPELEQYRCYSPYKLCAILLCLLVVGWTLFSFAPFYILTGMVPSG